MVKKKPKPKKPKRTGSWSDKILQQMGDLRGVRLDVTRTDNNIRDLVGDDRTTSYKVTFDQKSKPINILSRPENIVEYISLVAAIHQIIADFLGYYDFEDWFKEWQTGFPNLINEKNSKPGLKTNYPAKDTKDKKGWRSDTESQPQYKIKFHPTAKNKPKVVEYYPKGFSEMDNSIICSGIDVEIINQIINYEWNNGGLLEPAEQRETIIVSGHPQVILYFSAKKKLPGRGEITRTRISFRLLDKIEHSDYAYRGETVLTKNDVEQWKSKIEKKFKDYIFKRGDTIYSYIFKPYGYSFWHPLKNREEAVRFYSDVLSLQNHQFIDKLLKTGDKGIKKASEPSVEKEILGETITIQTAYTTEELYFRYALLHLPMLFPLLFDLNFLGN